MTDNGTHYHCLQCRIVIWHPAHTGGATAVFSGNEHYGTGVPDHGASMQPASFNEQVMPQGSLSSLQMELLSSSPSKGTYQIPYNPDILKQSPSPGVTATNRCDPVMNCAYSYTSCQELQPTELAWLFRKCEEIQKAINARTASLYNLEHLVKKSNLVELKPDLDQLITDMVNRMARNYGHIYYILAIQSQMSIGIYGIGYLNAGQIYLVNGHSLYTHRFVIKNKKPHSIMDEVACFISELYELHKKFRLQVRIFHHQPENKGSWGDI